MLDQRKERIDDYRKRLEVGGSGTTMYSGLLNGEVDLALTEAVEMLQQQIPQSVKELRTTISSVTDRMIDSNSKLAQSNEKYAKAMMHLTAALVVVSLSQIIITIVK